MRLRSFEDRFLAEAKVGELDVSERVEENVFGFKISVDDSLRVEMLESEQDLGQVEAERREK